MHNLNELCMGCMSETGNEQVCSVCGFDGSTYAEPGALPLRTVLAGRYAVGKAVSVTGEGFTYLGFDTVTESVVRITEYFPAGFCTRMEDGSVEISGETSYLYNDGIIQFIDLHKKLGSLSDVTSLYRVIDIFEVNKTAYCVSEYQPGISLKEFLIRNGGVLSWDQVRPLFLPLMTSLRTLHQNGIIHGGISPETLFVGRDGRVRITDFLIPAIRNARSQMTAQLYPGYAAVEQYRGENMTPATDVYAFAATMFRTLTGNPPPDSKQRLEKDNLTFPRSVAEQMPRSVLVAMANALQLEAEDRTSNIAEFKADLQSGDAMSVTADEKKTTTAKKTSGGKNKSKNNSTPKYVIIAAVATIVVIGLIVGLISIFSSLGSGDDSNDESSSRPSSAESYNVIDASSSPEKQQSVPDFSGKSLAELLDNEEYADWYEFKVVRKEYNNRVSRGKVCAQSVQIGTVCKKGTKVELTVSLGPSTVTIPNRLKNMPKDEAILELLKLGFDYNNIEVMGKMGDVATEEEVVIEASPAFGTKVSPDERVTLYYNTNIIVPESSDYDYGYDYGTDW